MRMRGMAAAATRVVMRAIHSSNKNDARLAMSLLEKLGVFERRRELERGERAPVWSGDVRETTEEEVLVETLDAVEASVDAKVKKLGLGALDGAREAGLRGGRGANGRFVAKRE